VVSLRGWSIVDRGGASVDGPVSVATAEEAVDVAVEAAAARRSQ
jgi:hypothetical protein